LLPARVLERKSLYARITLPYTRKIIKKKKYIWHIEDGIYQALFFCVFFHALLLLRFTDDIGDESKMMRHIYHPSHRASRNAANDDYIVQANDVTLLLFMVCYQ
jgi:hypothetical protein